METKELICVNCPKGCRVTVTIADGKVTDIKGYSCDKGKNYAAQETIRPMRVLNVPRRVFKKGREAPRGGQNMASRLSSVIMAIVLRPSGVFCRSPEVMRRVYMSAISSPVSSRP